MMAGGHMPEAPAFADIAADRLQAGIDLRAYLRGPRTSRRERASRWLLPWRGRRAWDLEQRRTDRPGPQISPGPQQPLGIRVGGRVEDRLDRALLDDPPRVHDCRPVGKLSDHAHVMGDPKEPR